MSQQQKSAYWKALKEMGVTFDQHYREYNTEQLAGMYAELTAGATPPKPQVKQAPTAPAPQGDPFITEEEYRAFLSWKKQMVNADPKQILDPARTDALPADHRTSVNRLPRMDQPSPDELPGERLNTKAENEPLRVDSAGRIWYQEEVRKAGYAKPRGRRVLKYMDSGVETKRVQNGDYVETFEVGGRAEVPAEVKVTLPSYQVGIYKAPNMPFKIHVYNGQQGFDLFEVQEFYGGAEMVPADIKRIYVSHMLCYDIRTVIRAIETEFRRTQLSNQNGI